MWRSPLSDVRSCYGAAVIAGESGLEKPSELWTEDEAGWRLSESLTAFPGLWDFGSLARPLPSRQSWQPPSGKLFFGYNLFLRWLPAALPPSQARSIVEAALAGVGRELCEVEIQLGAFGHYALAVFTQSAAADAAAKALEGATVGATPLSASVIHHLPPPPKPPRKRVEEEEMSDKEEAEKEVKELKPEPEPEAEESRLARWVGRKNRPQKADNTCLLTLTNLRPTVTKAAVRRLFSSFGPLLLVNLEEGPNVRENSAKRAFVRYRSEEDALTAAAELADSSLQGRRLSIQLPKGLRPTLGSRRRYRKKALHHSQTALQAFLARLAILSLPLPASVRPWWDERFGLDLHDLPTFSLSHRALQRHHNEENAKHISRAL